MRRRLHKIKTKAAIHAHRRTFELLDGEYRSIHHGRSHDFDDLREYTPGDEVKDIDWKATARSTVPLVKRYIASRQHNVVFVVDTGRNMAALAESGESKEDVALMTIGVLSYLAVKHGDRVALHAGNAEHIDSLPEGGSEGHLERMLRVLDDQIGVDAPESDVLALLQGVARRVRRRSIIVIISDDVAYSHDLDVVLGRLHVRHEVLWVSIGDADLLARSAKRAQLYDVAAGAGVSEFVRGSKSLTRAYDEANAQRRALLTAELRSLGIANVRIASTAEVVPSLFQLLERHRRVRR